jgi:hypothetical protein
MELKDTLFEVAKELGDLNEKGQVKGFSANEQGYVTAISITPGCRVYVCCTHSDRLKLYMTVTRSALDKDFQQVTVAVDKFNAFFDHRTRACTFRHAFDLKDVRLMYEVDVTQFSAQTILSLLRDLKNVLL